MQQALKRITNHAAMMAARHLASVKADPKPVTKEDQIAAWRSLMDTLSDACVNLLQDQQRAMALQATEGTLWLIRVGTLCMKVEWPSGKEFHGQAMVGPAAGGPINASAYKDQRIARVIASKLSNGNGDKGHILSLTSALMDAVAENARAIKMLRKVAKDNGWTDEELHPNIMEVQHV